MFGPLWKIQGQRRDFGENLQILEGLAVQIQGQGPGPSEMPKWRPGGAKWWPEEVKMASIEAKRANIGARRANMDAKRVENYKFEPKC